jgi:hypothetical protein
MPAGSEGALVAELNASIQKKSALVMMFWAPHWVLSSTETGWVDIPEDLVMKGSMRKPRTFKVVWPGSKDKWPRAFKFLQAYQITNDVQEPLMDLIDNQGQDAIEVTKKWVDENRPAAPPLSRSKAARATGQRTRSRSSGAPPQAGTRPVRVALAVALADALSRVSPSSGTRRVLRASRSAAPGVSPAAEADATR